MLHRIIVRLAFSTFIIFSCFCTFNVYTVTFYRTYYYFHFEKDICVVFTKRIVVCDELL